MQDSNLNNVGTAKIRKTYSLFERSLMDLLEQQNNPNHSLRIINQFGSYPSVLYRHPYINNSGDIVKNLELVEDKTNNLYTNDITQEELHASINSLKESSNGNYDGLIGFV